MVDAIEIDITKVIPYLGNEWPAGTAIILQANPAGVADHHPIQAAYNAATALVLKHQLELIG